jgi:hypothetical protein
MKQAFIKASTFIKVCIIAEFATIVYMLANAI